LDLNGGMAHWATLYVRGSRLADHPERVPAESTRSGACSLSNSYDKQTLDGLRTNYRLTHTFRRQGESILIFSGDGQFPVSGSTQTVALKDNVGIFCFLVKDGLIRHLADLDRRPLGFTPIELISTKPKTIFWPRLLATLTLFKSALSTP